MESIKDLLALRKSIKAKKPKFIRQSAKKKKRVSVKWRKPRGSDSKMRQGFKGYHRCRSMGWGAPNKVKNLDKSGVRKVLINSIKDIDSIDKEREIMVISKRVGMRKKIEIVKIASNKGLKILNIKDNEKFLKDVEEKRKKKVDEKKKKENEKETKKKALQEKAKEKDTKEDGELADKIEKEEKKKEEEKKEKDKTLTKKDVS